MRGFAKKLAAMLKPDFYQRLLAFSILEQAFPALATCRTFSSREALWQYTLDADPAASGKLTYIEFGVWQGYSIHFFAEKNQHPHSRFIGLDSFEGLPEDWGSMSKGSFSTDGKMPLARDARISFIKGWFQHSWDELQHKVSAEETGTLLVHYDADLYSSTLFALSKIDLLNQRYLAIFDEFTGHETRALYNYCQAYGAKVSFLGKTMDGNYPGQIACLITPSALTRP